MEGSDHGLVKWDGDRLRCAATNKVCFVNQRDAERFMYIWWAAVRGRGKRAIHAYKCPLCGFWHLTSKTQRSWERSGSEPNEPVDLIPE